jgi:hypothetical protein
MRKAIRTKPPVKKGPRARALASHLEIAVDEASELIESGDYLVLTDKEADSKARECILESVWAFTPAFLAAHLKEGVSVDVVTAIQGNGKCEDNNTALLSLIGDVDHFVDDAISSDGRGHLMSFYDGEEIELGKFYGYRVN